MQNEVTIGIFLTVLLIVGVLLWLFSSPKSSGSFLLLILFVIAVLGLSFALYSYSSRS